VVAKSAYISPILWNNSCKNDALYVQQKDGFDNLDQNLRHFIISVAQGHTALEQLVVRQSDSLKEHITAETLRLEQSIGEQVVSETGRSRNELTNNLAQVTLDQISLTQRERLLGSLKFPTMNERRNQIKDSHERTFEWIFGVPEDVCPSSCIPSGDCPLLT